MDLHQLPNKSEAELTPEERWRVEHIKMHEQHRGHEAMHSEMLLILIAAVIIGQIILTSWKHWYPKSYQIFTLLGMWVIPLIMCVRNSWLRFIFSWLVFSCITALIVRKALQHPIQGTTPRLVYKWFFFIYMLSYGFGMVGYAIILATFFGFNLIFDAKPQTWMDFGLLLLFYGLYYGVLARDIAEICADKMAAHIGYYAPGGMPTRTLMPNICAVCGNKLLISAKEEGVIENTYKLTCDHEFHEFCIRGWCIVGKKQTCPYCKEKVDLKRMFRNPWEKPHILYGHLLDWLRWLVAWQPVILFIVQCINWSLGLEKFKLSIEKMRRYN